MDELTPQPKAALATQERSQPLTSRRTRKRSRVTLHPSEAVKPITSDADPSPSLKPESVAISTADAWKAAVTNAYVGEMKQAVPEVVAFMDDVNRQVGEWLIDEVSGAYGISLTAAEED